MLDFFNNSFLNIYLILPFAFAIIIAIIKFIHNPIYLRKIAQFFASIYFVLSSILILCQQENLSINSNYSYDKTSILFSFLISFSSLLIAILSKTFIKKMPRMFFFIFFSSIGLVNIILFSNNLLITFLSMFWFILLTYFANYNYRLQKDNKRIFLFKLSSNIIWFLISLFLIAYDFLKYFILNSIPFNFENIATYSHQFDINTIELAFLGFLILSFSFFDFIPFNANNLKIQTQVNPLVLIQFNLCNFILGNFLIIHTYLNFNSSFFKFQEIITIALIVNFIYQILLILHQNYLSKYISLLTSLHLIFAIFILYSFEKEHIATFLYFILCLFCAILFSSLLFALIEEKLKTQVISEFKKFNMQTKLLKVMCLAALANFMKVPFLSLFMPTLITFLTLFSTSNTTEDLNIISHILLLGMLAISINIANLIYRILIEPQEKTKQKILLANHQILALILAFFVNILAVFAMPYFFETYITAQYTNLMIGN